MKTHTKQFFALLWCVSFLLFLPNLAKCQEPDKIIYKDYVTQKIWYNHACNDTSYWDGYDFFNCKNDTLIQECYTYFPFFRNNGCTIDNNGNIWVVYYYYDFNNYYINNYVAVFDGKGTKVLNHQNSNLPLSKKKYQIHNANGEIWIEADSSLLKYIGNDSFKSYLNKDNSIVKEARSHNDNFIAWNGIKSFNLYRNDQWESHSLEFDSTYCSVNEVVYDETGNLWCVFDSEWYSVNSKIGHYNGTEWTYYEFNGSNVENQYFGVTIFDDGNTGFITNKGPVIIKNKKIVEIQDLEIHTVINHKKSIWYSRKLSSNDEYEIKRINSTDSIKTILPYIDSKLLDLSIDEENNIFILTRNKLYKLNSNLQITDSIKYFFSEKSKIHLNKGKAPIISIDQWKNTYLKYENNNLTPILDQNLLFSLSHSYNFIEKTDSTVYALYYKQIVKCINNTWYKTNMSIEEEYPTIESQVCFNNVIWFTINQRLYCIKNDQLIKPNIFNDLDKKPSISDIDIDDSGKVWISSRNNGIGVFDGNSWKVYNKDNSFLKDNNIGTLHIDKNNKVWIGSIYSGVYTFENDVWENIPLYSKKMLQGSIYNIAETPNNKILIISEDIGLINNSEWEVFPSSNAGDLKHYLINNRTKIIDNDLFFISDTYDIHKYTNKTWHFLFKKNDESNSICFFDDQGYVWRTASGGDLEKVKKEHYFTNDYINNCIYGKIFYDKNNNKLLDEGEPEVCSHKFQVKEIEDSFYNKFYSGATGEFYLENRTNDSVFTIEYKDRYSKEKAEIKIKIPLSGQHRINIPIPYREPNKKISAEKKLKVEVRQYGKVSKLYEMPDFETKEPIDEKNKREYYADGYWVEEKYKNLFEQSNSIARAPNGDIWTVGKNLVSVYNGKYWKHISEIFLEGTIYQLNHFSNKKIWIDNKGIVYISTYMYGLLYYENGVWKRYHPRNSSLSYYHASCLKIDKNDQLWFFGNTVVNFDGKTWNCFNGIRSNYEMGAMDDNNNFWFLDRDSLVKFNSTTQGIEKSISLFSDWRPYNYSLIEIKDSALIFINVYEPGNKYSLYHFNGTKFEKYNEHQFKAKIVEIENDADGNTWFATNGDGLFKSTGQELIHFNKTNSNLPSDEIISILHDENKLWIATNNGIACYSEGVFETFSADTTIFPYETIANYAKDKKGNDYTIKYIQEDRKNDNITYRAQVHRIDSTSYKLFKTLNFATILYCTDISFSIDTSEGIWIAWPHKDVGYYKEDLKTLFSGENSPINGYSHSFPQIFIDYKQNAWTNTAENKIVGYNGHEWQIEKNGISNRYSQFVFCEDNFNQLWAFNKSQYAKYSGQKWEFFERTNNTIPQAAVCDNNNNFWILTDLGLECFNGLNNRFYDLANFGFEQKNYRLFKTIACDHKNNLWFCSDNRLFKFNKGIVETFDLNFLDNIGMPDASFFDISIRDGHILLIAAQGIIKIYIDGIKDANPEDTALNISGKVFFDLNKNNEFEDVEPGVRSEKILVTPDSLTLFTMLDGSYSFEAEKGKTYTIEHLRDKSLNSSDGKILKYAIADSASVKDINFGVYSETDSLEINTSLTAGQSRCGFTVPYWIHCDNNSLRYEEFELTLIPDSTMSFVESFPPPDFVYEDSVVWKTKILPRRGIQILSQLLMPDFNSMGDTLITKCNVKLNDSILSSEFIKQELTCAYDPNDKQVVPAGVKSKNYTLFDISFVYTIRFQNTGTDTAFNINVIDTLSSYLDASTFRLINASHDVETSITEKNIIDFRFSNILLPDSNRNEPLSHGFIKYHIKPKKGLQENTGISNTAHIFFDFNPPIVTNTTINTMVEKIPVDITSVFTEEQEKNKINVYPNPSQGIFYVNAGNYEVEKFEIVDINGRVVRKQLSFMNKIDLRNQPPGVYFVKFFCGEEIITTKLILQKSK